MQFHLLSVIYILTTNMCRSRVWPYVLGRCHIVDDMFVDTKVKGMPCDARQVCLSLELNENADSIAGIQSLKKLWRVRMRV